LRTPWTSLAARDSLAAVHAVAWSRQLARTLTAARAAGALARSEAMDVMPEGLAFYDADDRAVIWNARYSELNTEAAAP
jgi:hypothetical protein